MPELLMAKMLNKRSEILLIRSNKNGNIKISIFLRTQSKIVCLRKYFDSMWHISNSAHEFLISCTCCPSATNLSIKTSSDYQADSQLIATLLITSSNRPRHVAGCVSYCLSNRVASLLLFVKKGFRHEGVELCDLLWCQKVSSD